MGLKPMLEAIYPPPYCPAPNTLPPPPYLSACTNNLCVWFMPVHGRAGVRRPLWAWHGVLWLSEKALAQKQTRRKPQAALVDLPAFIYFLITNRDEKLLPLACLLRTAPPPPLHPFRCCCCCCYCPLIHIPLDWLLCETLNAKSEQNNTCSINASAGCQLAGSQFPLATSLLPASLEIYWKTLRSPRRELTRNVLGQTRRGEGALSSYVWLICGLPTLMIYIGRASEDPREQRREDQPPKTKKKINAIKNRTCKL